MACKAAAGVVCFMVIGDGISMVCGVVSCDCVAKFEFIWALLVELVICYLGTSCVIWVLGLLGVLGCIPFALIVLSELLRL